MRKEMYVYDKIKNIFRCTKKFTPSKKFLLCCSAVLFLFLILAAATAYYILPMEARGGADFNLRSISPLTSYVHKGEMVPLKFSVFTQSPGLYELKVYSPGGQLLFKNLKWVGKSDLNVWTANYLVESKEFGHYDVELSGLFNKNENQSYRTSLWIEDPTKKQKRLSESIGSGGKLSPDVINNSSVSLENNSSVSMGNKSSVYIETNSSASIRNNSSGNNSSVFVEGRGGLYINSIPAGSTIYLNGHEMGRTPTTIDDLPAGNYSLMLVLNGYETSETTANVLAGKTTPIYQMMAEIKPVDAEKNPLITGLFIKAFIIFLIAGFFVYVMIEVLLKDKKKDEKKI
jgi:hypothetical protein